ncbi:MAG: arsenic transporter [Rhizomicrobium sp.]|jgi:arsenical pump membrane protein
MNPVLATFAIWTVAALAVAGVVVRPFRLPEAVWAVAGAGLLVGSGLLPAGRSWAAVARGVDVYLFLAGMMLMSEVARREGVFDWVASLAVRSAKGSLARLFALVYGAGVIVTAVLSNDATAVVLTPAVYAAARKARVDPLPHLFTCALVANAASFVLPISNPANLVVYDGQLPSLLAWLARFSLPSLVAVVATFFLLQFVERDRLKGAATADADRPGLSTGGRIALAAIGTTAVVLLTVSALGIPLGAPTAVMGVATLLAVWILRREPQWAALTKITWSVVPLVAGLFVLVEALNETGATAALGTLLHAASTSVWKAAWAGTAIAFASNLMNNLPAGLLASTALARSHAPARIVDCILIGVDLGPNLSITGSLATILWLAAIRREGEDITFWRFLKVGAVVMPPALILALIARILIA